MILLDVDPSVVRPGWTPLIILIVLAAAVTLLVISMRRHMNRIQAPYRDEIEESGGAAASQRPEAPAAPAPDRSAPEDPSAEGSASSPTGPGDERHTVGH